MDPGTEPNSPTTLRAATLAIVFSTFLWGTLWLPLRQLDEAGLGGSWASTLGFTIPFLALLPVGVLRRRSVVAGGWSLARAGFLMAASFALYGEALLRGQVARVILLFYLAPVWSTLLARAILNEPVTKVRFVTITLGVSGMFVVLGIGTGVPLPRSGAEWMGLLSGFLCACSMVALRGLGETVSDFDKTFVQFLFLGPLFALITSLPGGGAWALPTTAVFAGSVKWLLLLGLFWMPAVVWLTIFGASRLDPGRVAVLLMLEVVIGVGSAALLAGEPFGVHELVGAALIVTACGFESFSNGTQAERRDPAADNHT